MQRRYSYLTTNFAKKMEQNLHETTNRWKTYGKRLFSEDLEVQDDGLQNISYMSFAHQHSLIGLSK
jgi:hypothetical protein